MAIQQEKVAPAQPPARAGVFRTKPLDAILGDAEKPEYQLRRALGPVQLTLFGIGAIIGAGIFATIGTAAAGDAQRLGAGPALIVSFAITAVACGFAALCYAEFASMVPISGSAYTYSYATLGELIAWVIGWDLIIEYAVGNTGVAISWANYFRTFVKGFGIEIPNWVAMDYRSAAKLAASDPHFYDHVPHLFLFGKDIPIVINLVAVGIVVAITLVLLWGIRESAQFNAVMVCIKIVVLLFFIVIGFMWVKPEHWTPFAPNGWAGISAGAAVVFFAYIGFDAVSTVAEETRNPKRNLPIGIIASLVICTVFYIVVAAVFTGLIPYGDLQKKLATEQAEPLTMALEYANPNLNWAVGLVAFGSVVAHTAVLLVYQLGQPRIFFAMARDGLLPPVFAQVHPRFRTPFFSTILTGVAVAAVSAFASIDEMVDLTNIGTLFAFILVCAGIIVLRVKDPGRPRPFRVPGGWLLPILGIISCLYLIYYLPTTSWLRFAAWLNFGFVIYVGYGAVHSRLTGREGVSRPAEHDAYTARVGARLAVAGVALLVLTHALEVWLESLPKYDSHLPQFAGLLSAAPTAPFPANVPWAAVAVNGTDQSPHPEGLTGMARVRAAFGDVFRADAWLQLSWFLLIPLAVNAFILCPVIMLRAWRVRRAGTAGVRQGTAASVAVAVCLIVLSVAYIGLVLRHHLGA